MSALEVDKVLRMGKTGLVVNEWINKCTHFADLGTLCSISVLNDPTSVAPSRHKSRADRRVALIAY